jgi:hypothetical protein
MPRRVYLLGLGASLVGLALAFTDRALGLQPGVTARNVRAIRPGMPLPDVEGLLGGPGRCYVDSATEFHWPGGEARRFLDWTGADGRAWVGVDHADRVSRFRVRARGTAAPPWPACAPGWAGEPKGVPVPRLTYFTGLALLLVAGAFLLTDGLLTPAPGVTEENVQRIEPGMRRGWVERVLGGPATEEAHFANGGFGLWDAGAGLVVVDFDTAGRVTASAFAAGAQARRIRVFLKALSLRELSRNRRPVPPAGGPSRAR